ncbi:MAG: ketoacyl-ACP synthase III [Segetibacter sp.]
MNDFGVGIISTGHYLPAGIQTNEELCTILEDTTPQWIIEKTGIKKRHFVSENETASGMSLHASKSAIKKAGISVNEIGLVIVASFSQDYLFPPMSAKIHKDLALPKHCQIIDINTNCTGTVTALTMAAERMQFNTEIKYALIIGVEVLSRFTNKSDKDTAIFFSDGASAIVVGKVKKGYGLINSKFLTDSSTYESVRLRGGGSSHSSMNSPFAADIGYIEQNGLATWKQAVGNLPVVLNNVVKSSGLDMNDINFFVFHQANSNLINYILKKLRISEDRSYNNVEDIGNTGSASIGIALSEANDRGLIKSNSYLVIAGVGAGFNFGASLWKME